MNNLRIIFMGTPDFAVESLRRLVESGKNIVAVITMPDKAVGRHHDTLQASPVKQYAVEHGIPVLQPERLKDETFINELRAYKADLQVVVAFRMLPEVVWAMPPLGTFNLHAALLPQYRGAAPINWAVINGDTETGVTTFFLNHDIDTGRIIHRVSTPIADTDTAGDIHDRLMDIGADLVVKTVEDIEAGNIETIDQKTLSPLPRQGESLASLDSCAQQHPSITGGDGGGSLRPAPKIFKETCEIRWDKHIVKSAYDFIRGLSPYPGAWTTLRLANGSENTLKIFFAEKELSTENGHVLLSEGEKWSMVNGQCSMVNGQCSMVNDQCSMDILSDGKTYMKVALPDGYLRITSLQLAGKRRMSVEEFLRGNHLEGAQLVTTPAIDSTN